MSSGRLAAHWPLSALSQLHVVVLGKESVSFFPPLHSLFVFKDEGTRQKRS